MSNRKTRLISEKIGELLVKQMVHELQNFHMYSSFANYFSIMGIDSLAEYYKMRAKEEMVHHDWIFDYLTDADYSINYPTIPANEIVLENLLMPFEKTIAIEIETTQLIYAIYEASQEEKDHMTSCWLFQKLIPEQIEEENTSRMALAIAETEGDIFIKSKEILKLLKYD